MHPTSVKNMKVPCGRQHQTNNETMTKSLNEGKGKKMKTVILAVVMIIVAVCPAVAQQAQMYDSRPKITVNGDAVINVKPDKIVITFGIETWNVDIIVAKQKNNDILKKSVVAIKASGVPNREIQTDHLSIEPRYKDGYNKDNLIGYFVRNTFAVTLTETDKVEELVTKVLQAGVNYVHGIDFQTTEFKKYREQARNLALRAAKEKAEMMAGVLGQSAGAPIQINEDFSGSPWWYYSSWSGWGYGRNQGMSQNVAQNFQGGSGEMIGSIALGKISIRANVTVTFELKN